MATWRQDGPPDLARQAVLLVAQVDLMMPSSGSNALVLLSRAADFAARRHVSQRRKGDAEEPYINHLTEVAALLAEDRKSTRLNSSHSQQSRMPSSA